MQAVKQIFYIDVIDDRVKLSPNSVWQSDTYKEKTLALRAGRRLVQELRRSDISTLTNKGWYLNPSWNKSCVGVKHHLHVYLIKLTIYSDKTHSRLVEEVIK